MANDEISAFHRRKVSYENEKLGLILHQHRSLIVSMTMLLA